jgi:hypothetical protein
MLKDNRALKADIILLKNYSRSVHVGGRPSSTRLPNLLSPAASYGVVPRSLAMTSDLSAGLLGASGAPAGSSDVPVSLSNGSRVTRKTISSAHACEYANLADYIPNNEPSNVMKTVNKPGCLPSEEYQKINKLFSQMVPGMGRLRGGDSRG